MMVRIYHSTWRRLIGLLQDGPRLATNVINYCFYLGFRKLKFLDLFPHIT
jgi:hypothetical protein